MNKSFRVVLEVSVKQCAFLAVALLAGGLLVKGWLAFAQSHEMGSNVKHETAVSLAVPAAKPLAASPAADQSADSVLDGFRHVEVASVADAMEQITGRKIYMSHRMHSIFTTKFAGYALTMLLKKQENKLGSAGMKEELDAIDEGAPNSVYVATVEDGADIAGMGGLMGTAMAARDFAGAVIDGGVRDTAYLRKIGFPVYSLGEVPSTSVNHYVFGGANVPITCDGVPVKPHDMIVADSDGVVVVPQDMETQVLAVAQKMDFAEHSMYPLIEQHKSVQAAVKIFGRI
jgi:regulator of RNase E activity RraA